MKRIENQITHNMWALQGRRTDQEMAYMIGEKSRQTWKDRMQNPKNLRLGELMTLAEKANVPLNVLLFGTVERRF